MLMADFQTIAGEFAVRVNDGMAWCVYHIRAATEAEAHALAARLWGQREGHRVEHVKEPMPEPASGGAVVIENEPPKAAPKPSAATSATSATSGGSPTSSGATVSGSATKPPEGGRTTSA